MEDQDIIPVFCHGDIVKEGDWKNMWFDNVQKHRTAVPFFTLIFLFTSFVFCIPGTVSATTIDSLSPGELVSGADLVVVAECVTSGWITARYRVEKSYKGELKTGDKFILRMVSTSSDFTEGLAGQHYFITAWKKDHSPPSRIMSMSMPRKPLASPPTFSSCDYITPLYQGRIPLTKTADGKYRYIGRRADADSQFSDFEAIIPKFIDSPLKTEYLFIDYVQTKARNLISYNDFPYPEEDEVISDDTSGDDDEITDDDRSDDDDDPDAWPFPDDDFGDDEFDDLEYDEFGTDDDIGEDTSGPEDDFEDVGALDEPKDDALEFDGDFDDFGAFGEAQDDALEFDGDFDDFGDFGEAQDDALEFDGDFDDFGDFGEDDDFYTFDDDEVIWDDGATGEKPDGWFIPDEDDDEFDEDFFDDSDFDDGLDTDKDVPDDSLPEIEPEKIPEEKKKDERKKEEKRSRTFLEEVEESYAYGDWLGEPMNPWQKVVAEIVMIKWMDDDMVARLYQKAFSALKELPECRDKRRIIGTLCYTGAPPLVDIVMEKLNNLPDGNSYERSEYLRLLLELAQHPVNLPRIKEETKDMDLPTWYTGKPPKGTPKGSEEETFGPDRLTAEGIKALPGRAQQEVWSYEMIKSMRHPRPHPNDVYQLTKKGMSQAEAEKAAPPTWRVPYHFELEYLDEDLREKVARVAWETMPSDLPQWKKLDSAVQLSVCRSEANTAYLGGLIDKHFDLLTADSIPEDIPMENDPDDLMKAMIGMSISAPGKVFDFFLRLKRIPESGLLSDRWMRAVTYLVPQLDRKQLESMMDRGVDDFKVLAGSEVQKRFPSDNKLLHKAHGTLKSVSSRTGTLAAVQADLALVSMGDKEAVPRLFYTFGNSVKNRQVQYRMMIIMTNLSYDRNPPDISAWYDFQRESELEDIWRRWWKENKHRISSEDLVEAGVMKNP